MAAVIWAGSRARRPEAEPEAAAAADEAPGGGEQPEPQPLGFPAAGRAVQGEHLHPGGSSQASATISHQIWFWA